MLYITINNIKFTGCNSESEISSEDENDNNWKFSESISNPKDFKYTFPEPELSAHFMLVCYVLIN